MLIVEGLDDEHVVQQALAIANHPIRAWAEGGGLRDARRSAAEVPGVIRSVTMRRTGIGFGSITASTVKSLSRPSEDRRAREQDGRA